MERIQNYAAYALYATMILSLTAATGCGEESIDDLVSSGITELNAQVMSVCDCSAELGFENRDACQTTLGFIGPSRERCVRDAYNGDEESSRAYLECYVPLLEEFTECVDGMLSCDSASSVDACQEDFDVGERGCIALPANVERDVNACF